MKTETITARSDLLIRRLVLEPGEAMPWHTDSCERFTVVVRGEALCIEFRAGERVGARARRHGATPGPLRSPVRAKIT